MTDRLVGELKKWRLRAVFGDDYDLVFAHPELGVPLDRTRVTRRFQAACVEAGARRSASTTFATPSRPRSPRQASRSGRSRNSSATRI
jgi:hypothetical protein